jgi:uncharacterized membrane protein YhiD involved in acid resistance
VLFALITLLCALSLSGIAAYYSVVGLIAIFSASPIPIAVMGTALECSKLIAASWAYKNWKIAPALLKYYFVTAVIVLMLITSLGIFGYLSKAHNDQTLVGGDASAQIAIINEKIKTSEENIRVIRKTIEQMDIAVDQILTRSTDESGAARAVALRRSQQKDRQRILSEIQAEQKIIGDLNIEKAPIAAEVRKVEAEVGPIKYIAALVYGDELDANILDKAVRFVIILLVLVFDPMAVLLVVAGNFSLRQLVKDKENKNGEYKIDIQQTIRPEEKIKRKRKSVAVDEHINATVFDPIPMTEDEIETAKRKYHRDGRSKFAPDVT